MSVTGGRDKRWALFEQKLRERGLAAASIPKATRTDAPLLASFAQERLLFLEQLTPGSAAYNDHYALRVTGKLDLSLLVRVLGEIAKRHETLRTTFTFGPSGEALQVLHDQMQLPLRHEAWTPAEGPFDTWVLAEAIREAKAPFDLLNGPLARTTLLSRGSDEHVWLFTIHHAIWDGWSAGVLAQELSALYGALASGKPSPLAPLETQYADYAAWQRERLSAEVLRQKVAFWKAELALAPASIDLPTDRARPRLQTFSGKTLQARLGQELSAQVDARARELGCTPFAVLFSTYAVLLARYGGQRELVIATPIANRVRVELEALIGCFVNTLALRVELDDQATLSTLTAQVTDRLLRAQPHQDLPFEKLVESLGVERDLSRSPVAQVMFVLQNTPPRVLEIAGTAFAPLDVDSGFAKLDLTLNASITREGYVTSWEFNLDLFDEATIRRMMGHYRQLLQELLAAPSARVFRVNLLQSDERRLLVYDWNQTSAPSPQEATLHQLFAQKARESPDAVAVVLGNRRFSYAEVAARARGIARALSARNVVRGDLVSVFLRRDEHLIPALLGVLMAGAAYVPLDPAYPQERIALILEDTDAAVLLTTANLTSLVPLAFAERSLDVASVEPLASEELAPGAASDRAYVIYTSGSTGKPKGVAIEHQSAVAFITWSHGVFSREELRGVLAATSVCFDLSIFEIFGTLLAGGTVIVADNALGLSELAAANQVTLINTVPSAAAELLRSGSIPESVQTVNLAGEALPEDVVLRLYALPHIERVYNLYGPSETTTYSTYTLATRGAWKPTIGRPIANTRAYALDEQLQPVPLGVRGELYLGGLGVARGYLNHPALTAARFLPDPFSDVAGARMYKTGDLVRWLASGELEYLGRNDHQVKLRGFRIELGEIEAALGSQASVRDAVVVVREDKPGLKALVAYVVAREAHELEVDELRAVLAASLPEYMVPARFVTLEALPLSPNGKVDRKRLPPPPEREQEREYVGPRNQVEAKLARIWEEVLSTQRVSVHDSFFELGGDSIAAMRLSALARRAGLTLTVAQIFQSPTLESLAERATQQDEAFELAALPSEPFALSPIQQWFFERKLSHPHHYNQSVFVELSPEVDLDRLSEAVTWTIQRHPSLRLHFEPSERGYSQRFGAEPLIAVGRVELSAHAPEARSSVIELVTQELEASLDFSQGPLGRVALFNAGASPKGLFIVLHHLVVDVVSWHVLLSDIKAAYTALESGVAPYSAHSNANHYAKYVERLALCAASPLLAPSARDWSTRKLDVPRLPRDFEHGENITGSRESVDFTLSAEQTNLVTQRARQAYRLGIDDVTLTALCLALRSWLGSTRVVVDVERHGRELPGSGLDLADAVGWFTALFPVVFEAPGSPRAALSAIKDTLHDPSEPGLSFRMLRYGSDKRARGHLAQMPEREVVYNFLGNVGEGTQPGAPFSKIHASSAASNHHPENARSHLLEVTAALNGGALDVRLTFSRSVHSRATMSALLERFVSELGALASHLADEKTGAFTRADFPLAHLSQAELDAHHDAWWPEVVDAYPLTPPQHAILVDVLRDPRAGYYVPQLHALVGALDSALLEKSLGWVIERHTALRTAFAWRGLEQPIQLVFADVACPITHEDWRSDAEPVRQKRLADFLARDREQGFALERAPLLRLFHARWRDDEDVLVWTIHHAISDGWSLPLIIGEVLAAYAAFARGERPRLSPVPPFRDYLAWLAQQDLAAGEAYFSEKLSGATPTDIGIAEDASYRQVMESTLELESATSRALDLLAKRHSVTLGVVIQAAWAVVLARYSARSDVVFGSVDSGRPEALDRVAEMVGMFVTTLPLRVAVDDEKPVSELLKDVQSATIAIREHAYVALARVTGAASFPALFQSICVIENYPLPNDGLDAQLRPKQVTSLEVTRFPLTVAASTRNGVKLAVSASLADPDAASELLEAWRHALEQMSSDAVGLVGEITLPQAARRASVAAYWEAQLASAPATRLASDRARSLAGARPRAPATVDVHFPEPLALARSLETRPALVLLGAFVLLTARYSAQTEVLIAVEVAPGRLVPIRADVASDTTFESLIRRLDAAIASGISQFSPLALESCRDRLGVAFSLVAPDDEGPPRLRPEFEVSAALGAASGAAVMTLSFDPALFGPAAIARIARQIHEFIQVLAPHPETRLRDVPFCDPVGPVAEPRAAHPVAVTVLDLFRARVGQAPEAIAIWSPAEQLTYSELDARSSAGAARLVANGVARGDRVAVNMLRSPTLVVALLAIVKAGAAFVGIDASTPSERVKFMLEDCNARLCIVEQAAEERLGTTFLLAAASLDAGEGTEDLPGQLSAQDLAYVIYTSGSTGRPKGVMVEHGSLCDYIAFYGQATSIGPSDRSLQFASPSFDVSVEEIFGALSFGATLVLRSDDITPRGLLAACRDLRLTVLSLPTAYWNELTRAIAAGSELPGSVRLVVTGGERATRNVLAQWQRHVRGTEVRLLNMYGPTEATISATYAELTRETADEREPPIGRPVAGAVALVVDASGNPVPVGVPGELLLGGGCLARGYLNRPELTAEKFGPTPFAAGRFYSTGDLVRWHADEQLEYLGRLDHQIKIRGFRVELGEIESALRGQPNVSDVVVVLRDENSDNPRIVAYIAGTATPEELRRALVGLPSYMVPAAFVVLDQLPLTRSGKIDRSALPAPENQSERAGVAPRTAAEAALAAIWQRVLGIERLGVDENFFALGGHSLLATQVVSRIQAELGIEATVRDLFDAPTVEQLAERLRGRESKGQAGELRRRDQKAAPLSFAQQRLWFLDQLEPGSAAYNMPLALRVKGTLDPNSLALALAEVARRHAILRTVFSIDQNGQPVQEIHEDTKLVCERETAPADADNEGWLLEQVQADASRPFDLATGPLLRARLLSLAHEDHALLFNMHHIVSDGWSVSVLVRELVALYRSFSSGTPVTLRELPIQYADYALWQRELLSGPELGRQLDFWKAELKGAPFRLDLPKKTGAKGSSHAGATLEATLGTALSQHLDALALELGATPFLVLFAAWSVLLSRVSGQAELVIGTPLANRRRVETEDMIGLFVNTLAIRVDLREGPSFRKLVDELRERLLNAQTHQDVPFEMLVDALHVERDLERSPIFQVMFAMQNTPAPSFELGEAEVSLLDSTASIAKFELTFDAENTPLGYRTRWEYRSDLFEAAFIAGLTRHFSRLLEALIEAPDRACSKAPLLSNEERAVILSDWNATERDYPDAAVHELIAAQARRTPSALAVLDDTERLTYAELDAEAERLAFRLLAGGAKAEMRIAIALERSARLVVALLAVQKLGAAYVPLDTALPQSRMRDILDDAQVALVLTESRTAPRVAALGGPAQLQIDENPTAEAAHTEALPRRSAEGLAYVLFTSGSTGRPKGVEITQRALVNLLWSMRSEPGISASDIVLAATSLSFDIAGLELYLPLLCGASVYVASREVATDGRRLAETLDSRRVTFFQATPSTYKMLLGSGFQGSEALKLLVGGEQLSLDLAEQLLTCGESLWNVYGPTETTIWSTCQRVTHEQLASGITIGKPIANTQAYVLDAGLEPVPIGVLGELYLGGHGLARGYASRAELTAERFLPNPFGLGRIYRTGDVARYRHDGELECLGRTDHQVKVRGFRVELGEIEVAIRRHPEIDDAAVDVQTLGADDQRLVAYVVSSTAFSAEALRRFLKDSLPEYMIPGHFVVLDRLPTTANGKLDRKALPAVTLVTDEHRVAPRDDTERAIAAIFSELLHVPELSVFDNFFDLGGHSLLGTELVFRLRREFDLELPVKVLFEAPTVAALAAFVRAPASPSRASLPKNVVLARQGVGVPWICFPALAGTAAPYLASVTQGAGPAVYLLEAPGLDEEPPLSSVEALAAAFSRAIRKAVPNGPIRLLGWSFGAVTAFATAQLLSAEGRNLEELVLVDPALPGSANELDEHELAVAFLADIAESLGKLSSLLPLWEERKARLREYAPAELFQLAKDVGVFSGTTELKDFETRFSVYTAGARALGRFTLSLPEDVYPGKALILAAREGNGQQTSRWLQFLPQSQLTVLEATHYTILRHLRELLQSSSSARDQSTTRGFE